MVSLEIADAGRENNLNLIRVLAATAVMFTHSFQLCLGKGAQDPTHWFTGRALADIALNSFFVLSGYLVYKSLFHRRYVGAFILARALRIFPGLVVCTVFCAFVVGVVFTTLPTGDYLRKGAVYVWLFKNTTLFDILGLPSDLPGVFKGLPFSSAVNGSLWTLPYEVWLYVSIAVLALLGIAERRRLFAAIACLFIGLFLANELLGFASRHPFALFFLRFTGLFYLGSTFALYGTHIMLSWKILAVATVALILTRLVGFYEVLFPLYTVYLVFVMAFLVKGPILNYNRLGDYSYGMYIYAYPLQQSLLVLFPGINPLKHFITSLACTIPMAVLSWHFIERPALSLKDKRVELPR